MYVIEWYETEDVYATFFCVQRTLFLMKVLSV